MVAVKRKFRGKSMGKARFRKKKGGSLMSLRGGSLAGLVGTAASIANSPEGRAFLEKHIPRLAGAFKLGDTVASKLTANDKPVKLYSSEVTSNAGSVTETEYTSMSPKSRLAKAVFSMSQRNTYVTNTSYRLASSIGSQAIGSMVSGLPASTLSNENKPRIAGIFTGNYISTASPGVVNTGSLQYMRSVTDQEGAVNTPLYATQRMFFNGARVETEIANLTNTPIAVDIYECVAKHDLTASNNVGGSELSGTEIYDPAAFWGQGLLNTLSTTGGTAGQLLYSNVNSTPYDSQLFNIYWKVASKVTINLGAGDMHRHTSTYKLDRVLEAQRFYYSSLLQGITRNIMIVIQGTPVFDSVSSTRVRTGPATVSVLHNIIYKYMNISGSKETTLAENTIAAVTTPLDTVDSDIQGNVIVQ